MKFSIRDVFWLTLVVALAICWFMDSRESRQRRKADLRRIQILEIRDQAWEAESNAMERMIELHRGEIAELRNKGSDAAEIGEPGSGSLER